MGKQEALLREGERLQSSALRSETTALEGGDRN